MKSSQPLPFFRSRQTSLPRQNTNVILSYPRRSAGHSRSRRIHGSLMLYLAVFQQITPYRGSPKTIQGAGKVHPLHPPEMVGLLP